MVSHPFRKVREMDGARGFCLGAGLSRSAQLWDFDLYYFLPGPAAQISSEALNCLKLASKREASSAAVLS